MSYFPNLKYLKIKKYCNFSDITVLFNYFSSNFCIKLLYWGFYLENNEINSLPQMITSVSQIESL